MILVGNRRGGSAELAAHLMNIRDNDHVCIHEVRGFMSNELTEALHEAYGISRGTRCQKFLYSLSLSPPELEDVSVEAFEAAIEKIERLLGFTGQPRAIVFHEKNGAHGYRRHAHVVWSRINAATMTAIDPYLDKQTLNAMARELFLEHGWDVPEGLKREGDADPFNYNHAEHQQSKRSGFDAKELKRLFADCWQRSDSKTSFAAALKEHGFMLVRGDRRGFVAVDAKGEIYSVAKWVGVKAKELRERFGSPNDLPSVEEAIKSFGHGEDKSTAQVELDTEYQVKFAKIEDKRLALVARHRNVREKLEAKHEARRIEEIKARSETLPSGLKAAWFKLSGKYEKICKKHEADAQQCKVRDRDEYQALIKQQLGERRAVQAELVQLQGEYDVVSKLLKTDSAQNLILPPDPEASTIKAKVQRDPAYILKVITDKHEDFTRSDIVKGLAEHFTEPLALTSAVKQAMQSDLLIEIQAKPVQRYSTQEMINLKTALSDHVDQLSQTVGDAIASRHVDAALARQDKALNASVGASLSGEQKTAIQHCLSPVRISCVVGLAGAGKSTMLSAVKDAFERQGFNIRGATLSGKAADELENSSDIISRTLASLEWSWKKGFEELTPKDVLVIDEAGMIGTRQLNRIIENIQKTGAKIILVGDPEQLQPINAGTPFKDITEQIGAINLREIHRQKNDWQKQASLDLAERRIDKALDVYEAHGRVKQARETSEAISLLVSDYMADRIASRDNSNQLALAYRRKDVFAINQQIRHERQSVGELSSEVLLQTIHGKRAFAPDDRILLTQNDHTLGIRNGMLGTVKSVSKDELVISVDNNNGEIPRTVTINPNLNFFFDHGYATTIHKSQGATVDRTYVLGSMLMDRHLTYVAMTRHKEEVTLYGDFNSIQKMRLSGLDKVEKRTQARSRYRRRGPTMH